MLFHTMKERAHHRLVSELFILFPFFYIYLNLKEFK